MGDRRQVVIEGEGFPPVYLYTHWGGSELPQIVANALRRGRSRRNDPEYLARIVFAEMIRDDLDGTTGYGISAIPVADANRSSIRLDTSSMQVLIDGISVTMQEFVRLHDDDLDFARHGED